jgi:hypothetical protein
MGTDTETTQAAYSRMLVPEKVEPQPLIALDALTMTGTEYQTLLMHSRPYHLNGQMLMAMALETIKQECKPTFAPMSQVHLTLTESGALIATRTVFLTQQKP